MAVFSGNEKCESALLIYANGLMDTKCKGIDDNANAWQLSEGIEERTLPRIIKFQCISISHFSRKHKTMFMFMFICVLFARIITLKTKAERTILIIIFG